MQPDINLAQFTTLNIGGPAKFFTTVKSIDNLTRAITWAKEKGLPYLIIGDGSNLLISDEGFAGLVIKNDLTGINLASKGDALRAYSGTPLQELVNFTVENGLGGLQKLSGIPGTLGGAIFGNAGAFGQTISDHLKEVACLDPQSEKVVTIDKDDCGFDYRDSDFKHNNLIILEAIFELEPTDTAILKQESADTLKQREKFNGLQCPGSFFKNIPQEKVSPESLKLIPVEKIPHGKIAAGYLLEMVGAKNEQVGEIKVTDWHANLFINTGEGKAGDFCKLAQDLAKKVKTKFGITLEPEVQLINLPPIQTK